MKDDELPSLGYLKDTYVLITKGKLYAFLGGAIAFLLAAGLISYQGAIKALEEKGAVETLSRLTEIETQAREELVPAIESQLVIGERTVEQIQNLRNGVSATTLTHFSGGEYLTDENTYEEEINLSARSLLFINAHGIASRSADKNEAEGGVNIVIKLDNKWCSSDQNYERSSIKNSFYAAASCLILLDPGIYKVHVERRDYSGNTQDKSINVTSAAIAISEIL